MVADLARTISAKLDKADQYDALAREKSSEASHAREKARNMRISAGIDLAEAQKRVQSGEEGNTTWTDWCKTNLPDRPERTIQKLLRLGKSDDPIREDDYRRQQDAEWQRKHRANDPPDMEAVRRVSHDEDVEIQERPEMIKAKDLFRRLTWDERGEFLDWVRETGLY